MFGALATFNLVKTILSISTGGLDIYLQGGHSEEPWSSIIILLGDNVLHRAAGQDADRPGLHWISLKSRRNPETVSICLLCLRRRDKGRWGWKRKKERVGVGWQGCRESKSLFPLGKVICKGIVPKSVTKGKMQSEGGGQKMEERNGMGVQMEEKKKRLWESCHRCVSDK